MLVIAVACQHVVCQDGKCLTHSSEDLVLLGHFDGSRNGSMMRCPRWGTVLCLWLVGEDRGAAWGVPMVQAVSCGSCTHVPPAADRTKGRKRRRSFGSRSIGLTMLFPAAAGTAAELLERSRPQGDGASI